MSNTSDKMELLKRVSALLQQTEELYAESFTCTPERLIEISAHLVEMELEEAILRKEVDLLIPVVGLEVDLN